MSIMNFTVTYENLTNDVDSPGGDTAAVACIGPMYFIPSIQDGGIIPALQHLPRAAGMSVRAFTAYMDIDGRLRAEAGGELGVRLWANDPDWQLERFAYQVRADLTDPLGRPIPFTPFQFDAPKEDRVVPLELEIPRPGQKFTRGRPAVDISSFRLTGDKMMVLTREDGYEMTTDALIFDDSIANSNTFGLSYAMTFGS